MTPAAATPAARNSVRRSRARRCRVLTRVPLPSASMHARAYRWRRTESRAAACSMVVLPLRRHSGAMTIAAYLTGLRWVDEPVLAAGQLRQGRRIFDLLRPRRCRLLPREFVLAVTRTRVVVFEAWGDAAG